MLGCLHASTIPAQQQASPRQRARLLSVGGPPTRAPHPFVSLLVPQEGDCLGLDVVTREQAQHILCRGEGRSSAAQGWLGRVSRPRF